jgi:RNA polymerase sigma-70 factor (ECF subfamily)
VVIEVLNTGLFAGRTVTFESLLVRHQATVVRTAQRLLGHREDAEDAAQEVFLRLHKHWSSIRVEDGVSSWLYRTTLNVCFDALRKRKFEPEADQAVEPDQFRALEREERRALLSRALLKLPDKERAAVVLREIEGLETREVAAILGSSEETVRSQVSTGRARLKRILEGGRP